MKGTVKWYNATKGFGFIVGEEGKDYFLHVTTLEDEGISPKDVVDGASVEFEATENPRGPQASKIKFV